MHFKKVRKNSRICPIYRNQGVKNKCISLLFCLEQNVDGDAENIMIIYETIHFRIDY